MGLASLGATDDEISKLVRCILFFYPWIDMSWTEEHYDSEHNDGEHYDCAQNIFSRVFYVWSGVLLFLHCGIRPLPRGRSNESKNNSIGKENILQTGSSESRYKINAIENILQRSTGLKWKLENHFQWKYFTKGFCKWNISQKVYGAGLLSSAAELQFVMDGVESGSLPLLQLEEESVCSAEIMVWHPSQLQRRFKTFGSRWPHTRSSTFTLTLWKVPLSLWGPSPATSKGRSAWGVLRSQLESFFTFFLSEVQPVHADRGGVEQLGQDLGRGEGAEGGPGHRGQRLEESQ